MSVQSVSSASVAADVGAARKRAAGNDSDQASETFALPEDAGPAAPDAGVKPAADAKSSDAQSADSKAIDAKAADAKPAVAKADTAVKAPAVPQAGKAPSIIIVPEPDGAEPVATTRETPPAPVTPQTGASALLTAAIAAQAKTPVKTEAEEPGEKDTAKTDDAAAPGVVDPAAILMIAAVPADGTTPIVTTPAADGSTTAAATAAGLMPAAMVASVEPAATTAAAVAGPGFDAGGAIAATAGHPAGQKNATAVQLPGSEADTIKPDKAKGDEAGVAAPAAGGHPAAAHLAKGEGADPVSSFAPQDATQQPESKVADVLQPLQAMIDLSASTQARPARPDPALVAMTPEQAAAQAANAQAQTAMGQPTPLHVVPIEIGLRALAGGRKFDIRLDPAELGRVDVSLDISDKGEVTAKLVVDRVETLHMLQRDSRTLERAFEQAGLKPSNAGVDITLRDPGDQSGFRQNRQHDEAPRRARVAIDPGEDVGIGAAQPVQSTPIRGLIRLGGVDLSI